MELLTIKEVANKLRCSEAFVRLLVARGELRAVKDGRFVRVFPDEIGTYLARHATVKPPAACQNDTTPRHPALQLR